MRSNPLFYKASTGILSVCALTTVLVGCSIEKIPCQIQHTEPALAGNAGCWLVSDNKLLMIEQSNGLYSIPGGTSESGETAQCTAHRETWEEAGVDVKVGKLKHQFGNGFFLFECFADNISLETNDAGEVKQVLLVDPTEIPSELWRFPKQRKLTLEWMSQ